MAEPAAPSTHLTMERPPPDSAAEAWTTVSGAELTLRSPPGSPRRKKPQRAQATVYLDLPRAVTEALKGGQKKFTSYMVRLRMRVPVRMWVPRGGGRAAVRVENDLGPGAPLEATEAVRGRPGDAAPAARARGKDKKRAAPAPAPGAEVRLAWKTVELEVPRRYSDFLRYHKEWRARHPQYKPLAKIFKLPKKKWFYNNFQQAVIDERVDGLESYMTTMMHYPVLAADLLAEMGLAPGLVKHLKPVFEVPGEEGDGAGDDGSSDAGSRASSSRHGSVSGSKSSLRSLGAPAVAKPPRKKKKKRRSQMNLVASTSATSSAASRPGAPAVEEVDEVPLPEEGSLRASQQRPSVLQLDMQAKFERRHLHESGVKEMRQHRRSVADLHAGESPMADGFLLASSSDDDSSSDSDSDSSDSVLSGSTDDDESRGPPAAITAALAASASRASGMDGAAGGRGGAAAPGDDIEAGVFPGLALLAAIAADDLATVRLAVEDGGVDVDRPIGYLGYTALQWARLQASGKVTDFLLAKGKEAAAADPADPIPPIALENNYLPGRWQAADA